MTPPLACGVERSAPPSVEAMCACSMRGRLNARALTAPAYPPHSRLSFVSHHAERISIASVKRG